MICSLKYMISWLLSFLLLIFKLLLLIFNAFVAYAGLELFGQMWLVNILTCIPLILSLLFLLGSTVAGGLCLTCNVCLYSLLYYYDDED
jgi:hypothetical protein